MTALYMVEQIRNRIFGKNRMNRKYLLYFLLVISFQLQLLGQTNQDYKKQFKQNVTFFPQEKVFLHSDKPYYFTGETFWFKLYVLDATFHSLSEISKVAYVEILGEDNLPIFQERIMVDNGMALGQFYINSKISTGVYRIRAYTSLMKNQPEEYFFEREINIINPFKTHYESIPEVNDYYIRFYPEGGVLVNGLRSRVAVQVINNLGEAVADTVKIMSGDEEIAYCVTSEQGIGSFEFSPKYGISYSATLPLKDREINSPLPNIKKNGIVLNFDFDTSVIEITSSKNYSEPLNLLLHCRSKLALLEEVVIENGKGVLHINQDKLEAGVNHITVLDEEYRPLAERLFFKYPEKSIETGLKMNGTSFGHREKVNVQLLLDDSFDASSGASLTVYKVNQDLDRANHDPIEYLYLQSDLNGEYVNSEDYLRDKKYGHSLDEAMMVYGWRRFDWENMVPELKYVPEIQAPIINGKISDTSVKPDKMKAVFSGKNGQLYTFSPKEDNSFSFEISPFIEGSDLLFWSKEINVANLTISVEDPFFKSEQTVVKKHLRISPGMVDFFEDYALDIQFANSYTNETKNRGEIVSPLSFPFYGVPDASYKLEDYTQFPTLQEVFKEYVRFASTRKKNGIKQLHVKDFEYRSIDYNQAALLMIDGAPIKNLDYLWSLDVEEVNRIDVVSRQFTSGKSTENGLINVITHKGNLGGKKLPEDVQSKIYKSILQPRIFYAPVYTNKSIKSRIPDYRNTLLWEAQPTIKNGMVEVEFFTSDASGEYNVEVVGIGKNGEILFETQLFEVIPSRR